MKKGMYCTDEPCIHCGHKEFFWYDWYEQQRLVKPRKNIKVLNTNNTEGVKK